MEDSIKSYIFPMCLFIVYIVFTVQGLYALEETFALKKNFDAPTRDYSIIVTPEGYYPKTMSAFVGEKVRFFVTSTTEKKECLILQDKKLFLSVGKGKVAEGVAYFNEPGVYDYYCPTGQYRGTLTILERPSVVKKKRALASQKDKTVRFWMPRDE